MNKEEMIEYYQKMPIADLLRKMKNISSFGKEELKVVIAVGVARESEYLDDLGFFI
jgi:hypothetical protein